MPKAVVNAVKGNNLNAVKASACWVWKPKTKVLDHVSKYNSTSITLKKFNYIDAQGFESKILIIQARDHELNLDSPFTPRWDRTWKTFQAKNRIFSLEETPVVTMADQRTMAELLQAPTEGYNDAIVIPAILGENFELKHDSLNAVTGGNLLTKTPRDALTIIENKSKVRNSRNKPVVIKVSTNAPSSSTPCFPKIAALANAIKVMHLQKSSPLASVKAVEEICVTCGGPHPYHQCLTIDGNVFPEYQDNIQGYVLAVVDYVVDPRVPLILERPFLRTRRALINVYDEELTLRVDDKAIKFNVGQTSKYSYNDAESINQIDVTDRACKEYVQEVLGFSGITKSGNPTPISDPIIALSSPLSHSF
uniref:Reverse transcriptase domain-containing protein n=1 Tax=Tanacetum cinerariifolium TaxID=118510 RepID=A0A6L2NH60_TANCI|nr:reverse transcriptase domain-containing protein [Tanacetum cinerariifolium]